MSTSAEFAAFVADQAELGTRLTHRRMFGEYALYLDGKTIGFLCDNSVFIKPTEPGQAFGLPVGPPYRGARDYLVADSLLERTDALRKLFVETAQALPVPEPRRPRGAGGRKKK